MSSTSILRTAVISCLFAALFIPFIVASPFFFPFITGKAFAFRILVEIAFGLWVILALHDPSVRPRKSLMLYAVLGLLASLAISAFLAENPSKALWSNFERMEGYISFLHFGAFFVVLTSLFRDEKLWRRFFGTSIAVAVLLGLYGVMQLLHVPGFDIHQGGVRVDATFGNATYLAIYMLFHFFITVFALIRWNPGMLAKIGLYAALVLETFMIFYAATRGTILGLVGGLFLAGIIVVALGGTSSSLRKWGAGLIAVLVVLVGLFFALKDTSFVRDNEVLTRLASISLNEGATRFTIWGMASQGFLERPVFGWGQEGFNYVFNKYYRSSLYAQEPWFDRAHNEFIDMALAGGVAAFLLYLSLFGLALWYLWRSGSFSIAERALFTGLFAGYAFHNFFVFDNLMSYVLFLSVLAYLTVKRTESSPPIMGATTLPVPTRGAVSAAVIVLLFVVLYIANVPGMARAADLIEALKPHCVNTAKAEVPCQVGGVTNPAATAQDLSLNLERFKRAVAGGGIGRQEAYEQLVQFALQIRNSNLAGLSTDAFKSEVVAFASEGMAKEVAREPNDARVRLFFGSFLRQVGDHTGAERELAAALAASPQKQAILFELGLLAFDKNDAPGALNYFKAAYDLAPEYGQARINYAAILIRVGRADLAEPILKDQFGGGIPDNDLILQSYVAVRDFGTALAIVEERVRLAPDDSQKRIDAAAVYLSAGKRADAVTSLKEAIRLNPSFEAQGQYYIQEIEAGRNP